MRTNHFAKGGQIIGQNKDKYARIDITDKYDVEALYELDNAKQLTNTPFTKEARLKAIQKGFDDLILNINDYLISKDSNDITRAINQEIEARREQGDTDENLERYKQQIDNPSFRKRYIDNYYQTQKNTIDEWARYLTLSEYPVSFKYLMLKAVLNYNYNLKTNKLEERTDTTTRGFTPFDAGTLSQLYDVKSNFLLKDYAILQNENSIAIANAKQVAATSEGGKWIRFEGGRNVNDETLAQNARELSALVQDTTWCTKTLAKSQLTNGDFYVYATEANDKLFPRIGIRMEGEKVAEVRGTASSAQDIEPEMLPIAEDFLKNNMPNNSGDRWLNNITYNRKAKELYDLILSDGINIDRLKEYNALKTKEKSNIIDYANRNGNIVRLENEVNKQIASLPNKYIAKNEVCTDISNFDINTTKVFIGNMDVSFNANFPYETLGVLELIMGSLRIEENNKLKDLGKLRAITNTLKITNSAITNIDGLKECNMVDISDQKTFNSIPNIENASSIVIKDSTINKIGNPTTTDYIQFINITRPINEDGGTIITLDAQKIEEISIQGDINDLHINPLHVKCPNCKEINALRLFDVPIFDFDEVKSIEYLEIVGKFTSINGTFSELQHIGKFTCFGNENSTITMPKLLSIKNYLGYNKYQTNGKDVVPYMPLIKSIMGGNIWDYSEENFTIMLLNNCPQIEEVKEIIINENIDINISKIKKAETISIRNNEYIKSLENLEDCSILSIYNCPNLTTINTKLKLGVLTLDGQTGNINFPPLDLLRELNIYNTNTNIDNIAKNLNIGKVYHVKIRDSNIGVFPLVNTWIDYNIRIERCLNIEEITINNTHPEKSDNNRTRSLEIIDTNIKTLTTNTIEGVFIKDCHNLEYIKTIDKLSNGIKIINSENLKQIVYDKMGGTQDKQTLSLDNCGAPIIDGLENLDMFELKNMNVDKLPDGLIKVGRMWISQNVSIKNTNDLEIIDDISFNLLTNNDIEFEKLKEIKGYVSFGFSMIDTQNIEKLPDMGSSEKWGGVKKLKKVKTIVGGAYFNNFVRYGEIEKCSVEDLGILQKITKEAIFMGSKIKEIKHLKTIGYGANFRNTEIEDISCIKSIGTTLGMAKDYNKYELMVVFDGSKIKDISHIEFGKRVYIVLGNRVDLLPQLVGKGINDIFKANGEYDRELSNQLKLLNQANKKSGGIVQLQNVNKARIITDGNMPF